MYRLIRDKIPEIESASLDYAACQTENLFLQLLNIELAHFTNSYLMTHNIRDLEEIQIILSTLTNDLPDFNDQVAKNIAKFGKYDKKLIGFYPDNIKDTNE